MQRDVLLANALLDFSNERFVLLSETCIPLFNFTTIYNHLINSYHSFQGSFDDPRPMGRGRYNKRMFPTVSLSDWRKGSQWFEVHRKIALEVISDVTYYPVFKDHCRPPVLHGRALLGYTCDLKFVRTGTRIEALLGLIGLEEDHIRQHL
ncbi:Core-2/I-branching beta-1,6-N-acetylglucosaminyltransferase family protein [Melia azedarach]|uniref:Core-2/I-branching beta-1,6-N-acetylglucosaminyltransferase family protein n=1 Tax=Melia azedarach TaxID=155640 RepID=A0ACC1XF71_MELAZ|nr:Core-2/I-branching beta-1,6-N-acetylglucosaminyltransferase family protein [Melia azedarach]